MSSGLTMGTPGPTETTQPPAAWREAMAVCGRYSPAFVRSSPSSGRTSRRSPTTISFFFRRAIDRPSLRCLTASRAQVLAAVDAQRLPGHAPARPAGTAGVGHVVRCRVATQRERLARRAHVAARRRLGRQHGAERQFVDTHARRQRQRQAARQPVQADLADRVGEVIGPRAQRAAVVQVHDVGRAVAGQLAREGLRQQERRAQVHRLLRVPLLRRWWSSAIARPRTRRRC